CCGEPSSGSSSAPWASSPPRSSRSGRRARHGGKLGHRRRPRLRARARRPRGLRVAPEVPGRRSPRRHEAGPDARLGRRPGRRWWAARGEGAHVDDSRIRVSAVRRIEDATFCYTSARSFAAQGLADRFLALAERSWVTRGFGDFWMHMLVAEGAADAAVDGGLQRWDTAAVEVIVEEAGGRFSGLDGRP